MSQFEWCPRRHPPPNAPTIADDCERRCDAPPAYSPNNAKKRPTHADTAADCTNEKCDGPPTTSISGCGWLTAAPTYLPQASIAAIFVLGGRRRGQRGRTRLLLCARSAERGATPRWRGHNAPECASRAPPLCSHARRYFADTSDLCAPTRPLHHPILPPPPPPPPHITPSSPVKAVLSYPDALPPTSPPPILPLSSAVCSPLLPSGCSSTTPVLPPVLTTSPPSHNTQRTPRLRHAAPPHLCCFPPPFAFGGVSRLRGTLRLCLRLFRRAGTGCDAKLRTSLAHGETHSTFFLSTPAGLVFCASPFRAATSSMAAALTTTRPSSSRPPAI